MRMTTPARRWLYSAWVLVAGASCGARGSLPDYGATSESAGAGGAGTSAIAGAGGQGSAGTTGGAAGAGGAGGALTCGDSCLHCCNYAACPKSPPPGGGTCDVETQNQPCAYDDGAGCLDYWFCSADKDPGDWSEWTGNHYCGGECPPFPLPGDVCIDAGMKCPVQTGDECWILTCLPDHHWTSKLVDCAG